MGAVLQQKPKNAIRFDADEVRRRIDARMLADYAGEVYGNEPARVGSEWRIGKGHRSGPGSGFTVSEKDGKVVWKDYSTGDGGNVFDFVWQAEMEGTGKAPKDHRFGDVVAQTVKVFCLDPADVEKPTRRRRDAACDFTAQEVADVAAKQAERAKAYEHFCAVYWPRLRADASGENCAAWLAKRGLPGDMLTRCEDVGWAARKVCDAVEIPAHTLVVRDPRTHTLKYIPMKADGGRTDGARHYPAGGSACVWRPWETEPDGGDMYVTEGETSALALMACGLAAIPVKPDKEGEAVLRDLAKRHRIILAYDNDGDEKSKGRKYANDALKIVPDALNLAPRFDEGDDPNDFVKKMGVTDAAREIALAIADADAERAGRFDTIAGLLDTVRTADADGLPGLVREWIEGFYRHFYVFDEGLCEASTGYLHRGFDYTRIMRRPVIQAQGEGRRQPAPLTVQDVLMRDTNHRRRVELREVRNYCADAPVTVETPDLQYGERCPRVTVNALPRLAPHGEGYGDKEREIVRLALCQFLDCFDTPKEFLWALNCVCHKAAFGDMTRRSKCILFLFDDGLNGNGAGRGKTLFATLPRFLYGRDHVSTTRKKYGFRAEKDFDGTENLMLYNVCNEFRPVNQRGYMDELCAFVDQPRMDYTEKGKPTIEVDTVCQLILTANTASEMELTNRTRRRFAFLQFARDWSETEGAAAVYRMCGSHGDEWQRDDDPEAVRVRACLWDFCRRTMTEGGPLYAPVLADVDKALGHTAGQELARQQKAQGDTVYQKILDYLDLHRGPISAAVLAGEIGASSFVVAKAIKDNGARAIRTTEGRRGKMYALCDSAAPCAQADADADTSTVWRFDADREAVRRMIADALR